MIVYISLKLYINAIIVAEMNIEYVDGNLISTTKIQTKGIFGFAKSPSKCNKIQTQHRISAEFLLSHRERGSY